MSGPGARSIVVAAIASVVVGAALYIVAGRRPRPITVDYPLEGSVFPPEFPPPTCLWRDASPRARVWAIDVSFGEGAAPSLHATSRGEPLQVGEIDHRAVGPTNELPKLTPEQAAARAWAPDAATWDATKKGSTTRLGVLTITGFGDAEMKHGTSRSCREKGVIKPLDKKANDKGLYPDLGRPRRGAVLGPGGPAVARDRGGARSGASWGASSGSRSCPRCPPTGATS